MPPLPPRLGFNTSLYQSIPLKAAETVENAIWLKTIGQADVARSLFEQELKPFSHVPIVIIEHADLELEAGYWGRAWRLHDAGLRDLKERNMDLDLPEHRLMALTRAMLGIRHRGAVIEAAKEVERTRLWLWSIPVAEYTDIQTSCIRRYVIAYMLVRLGSSYAVPEAESIPMPIERSEGIRAPWAGLRDLWQTLLDSRLFNEANSLFRVLINRTELPERDELFNKMLNAIENRPLDLGKHFFDSSIRLQWVETYIHLHNLPRAMDEVKQSQATLDMFCEYFSIPNPAAVPQTLALKFQGLYFEQDPLLKLHSAEQLIEAMEQYGSAKKGPCIDLAADATLALYAKTSEDELVAKFFNLHQRIQEYDETESEDLCDLITHRTTLIRLTSSTLTDRQKSLEWIEGFFAKYDYFHSPNDLQSLYSSRSTLLRGLNRIAEAEEAEKKANQYRSTGSSLGKYLNMSLAATLLDNPGHNSEEEEEEDIPFFEPWARVVGDIAETSKTIVDFLLSWASDDISAGLLTGEEFRQMLRIPQENLRDDAFREDTEYLDKMRACSRLEVFTHNFFPINESDKSHEKRCELVSDWLSKPPKGQRSMRLFCSILMCDVRQYHFSAQHLWDLRISELHRLLAAYENLPPLVKQISRSMKASWLGALALTYQAQLEDPRNLNDQEIDDLISKVEKYLELADGAFRSTNQPAQIAIHKRAGASLCLCKIQRLKRLLSEDPNDSQKSPAINIEEVKKEILETRSFGLKNIEETDQVFTASELQASWLDGLQGISDRQTLSAIYTSFFTIETAIQLLMSGLQELSQDDITNIWRWVQKYKARSLSRSIGMYRDSPASLVNQILASPEDRDMYMEMLSLQQQIDAAEQSARFHLRKKIDAHRQRMKKHELLRNLIDLREGTPLDVSDVDAINAGIDSPIVLVDWFILPSYAADTDSRILLLTARAGSIPTIDILTTKLTDIVAWQQEYLDPSKTQFGKRLLSLLEAPEFRESLGSLVAPLAQRTKKDEVLVFCPSNILHRLPLHALSVTESLMSDSFSNILIQRNPIVYIHSHSLLRSCISASELSCDEPAEMRPQFVSGIMGDANYHAGRASIRNLAEQFGATPLIDNGASKDIFLKKVPQSRMLHLQTHCMWDNANPLSHFLEFPNIEGDTEAAASDRQLTAREVFNLRLIPGTHFTMIACQGGLTEVKSGDEVMGLVPALLYSGASSTISTLWSISDGDGARFSDSFFKSLIRQCIRLNERGLSSFEKLRNGFDDETYVAKRIPAFVNTAKALQDAVLSMDIYETPLYSWAGFVLHGFWQFPLCKADIEKFWD